MDLNHIELSPAVFAELYPETLIGEPGTVINKTAQHETTQPIQETLSPVITKSETWRSLGNNQQKILIIVQSPDAVHLPDKELEFLTGILSACKLTLADVAIVNIQEQTASYKELTSHFGSRIVFLFDVDPVSFGLPINFPHYQIQAYAGNSFIYAPALKALENDRLEKSKLWVSLKRLFNL